MKKLYITVATLFFLCIVLFVASFVYLDRSKHRVYYYTINLDDHDIGTVKIDRFNTEDETIYKSYSNVPFEERLTRSKTKIEFDSKYNFKSYIRERYDGGLAETVLLENNGNTVSFFTRLGPNFACLSDIPVKNDTFIFEEHSPLTYLPILDNYNFRKGRAQGFNGLIVFSAELPPMKRVITLTSIKDEYLKIGARNIKTENLLLKIKNYPQGSIWVAKSDRSLIKLEIPATKFRVMRTFAPKELEPRQLDRQSTDYSVRDVLFNDKNVRLAGTMTFPKAGGPFPAVVLVAPFGSEDREYRGFFASIADHLSRNGFCVLRFDKRGAALSTGNASSHTLNDELDDLGAGIDYLAAQKEVDPQKIALISHSSGAYLAMKLAAGKDLIKAVVLMSPSLSLYYCDEFAADRLKNMALKYMWNEDYLKLAMKSVNETEGKIKDARHGWTLIMGKLCFVKNLKEDMAARPMEVVKEVKAPVLILRGKDDEEVPADAAAAIDKALGDAGNQSHLLRYYGYLGHFPGKRINDGVHKIRYEADNEVMSNTSAWLHANFEVKK